MNPNPSRTVFHSPFLYALVRRFNGAKHESEKRMRRDKLSIRIAIMETLHEPTVLTHISSKTRLNQIITKRELRHLMTNNLVTTTISPKKPFQQCKNANHKRPHYILTPRGTDILARILAIRVLLD